MQTIEQFGSDTKLTNELINGKVVCQSFKAVAENLSTISVSFATYKRNNSCKVCFEVCDNATGTPLFKQVYEAGMIRDNSFFNFPVNIKLVPNNKYDLVIYSDGLYGNAVTAKYGIKKHYEEKMTIGEDIINNGELSCSFEYEKESFFIASEYKTKNKSCGLISIVIPVYNSQKYLKKLFDTISSQTYNHYEVIVVDDGSEKCQEISDIVSHYRHLNTKLIRIPQNKGACYARNAGALEAMGEYLFFCDSDVVLSNKILQKMIQALHSNPDCSWAYCNFSVGNDNRKFMPFNETEMRKRNLCCTMSLMRHEDFCGFREELKRLQDWDLFLTMMENGKKGIWINEYLFSAEDRPGITTASISWEEAVREIRKHHKNIGA